MHLPCMRNQCIQHRQGMTTGKLLGIVMLKVGSKFHRTLKSNKRKKFLGLSTLSASISIGGLFFLISWISGFLIAKHLGSKETGRRSKIPSIIIPLGMRKIHLHHWLICSMVIVVVLLRGSWFLPSDLLYGFLGGVAVQGIYYYDDWHRILGPRQGKISSTTQTSLRSTRSVCFTDINFVLGE